ncbi:sigma-70 family RNA polymerase sigma factor [Prolixibacteraceae bacterium JC049]|nr:sigma-70 family RNA polymerase sigma factor [Prolixibacteraceae bacterium JC049]
MANKKNVKESELWKNVHRGDVDALKILHGKYFFSMCLWAKDAVADDELVERVVSDCFIALWENRKRIQLRSSIKSYLFQMLRNKLIDVYRSRDLTTQYVNELPDVCLEEQVDLKQHYVKLYETILLLPEQRRKILEMAAFEGMTYNEIAEKMHISKNTVKTQIARAYRFLKENLDPGDFYLFCILHKK